MSKVNTREGSWSRQPSISESTSRCRMPPSQLRLPRRTRLPCGRPLSPEVVRQSAPVAVVLEVVRQVVAICLFVRSRPPVRDLTLAPVSPNRVVRSPESPSMYLLVPSRNEGPLNVGRGIDGGIKRVGVDRLQSVGCIGT